MKKSQKRHLTRRLRRKAQQAALLREFGGDLRSGVKLFEEYDRYSEKIHSCVETDGSTQTRDIYPGRKEVAVTGGTYAFRVHFTRHLSGAMERTVSGVHVDPSRVDAAALRRKIKKLSGFFDPRGREVEYFVPEKVGVEEF